jgi:hypothetical protein
MRLLGAIFIALRQISKKKEMIQKKYTKSGLFIALIALLSFSTTTFAQQLGIYNFTGHTCPAPLTAVSAQPANAVFSDYSRTGATCTAAADVFNSTGWTLGASLDPAKYFEFTITPNACTVMNLDSLKFLHRVSTSGGAVTVVLRSSLDGFTADLHNAPITSVNTNVNLGIDLPASFNGLTSAVTFRTYVVNILSITATYRHDNVALIGTATTYPLANYYQDLDGDGFGNPAVFVNTCTPPLGYVANSTDCDDNNNLLGAGTIYYQDFDTDGFGNAAITQTACTQPVGYVTNDDDCNDNNNLIGVATTVYYQDFDTDGFGNPNVTQTACTQPVGYVTNDDDCNDNNNLIGVATTVFYEDNDNDTYGDGGSTIIACTQPLGYVSNADDCDDNNNAIHPGATETCDGIDNNCVGGIDDNVVTQTWYLDSDTDGFGNAAVSQSNCAQPIGYVLNDDDCDDNNNLIGVATTIYYADADADGFGNAAVDSVSCTQPVGYVANSNDCDDSNGAVGVALSYYPDADGDNYGSANATATVACTPPANYVTNNTDCNDANPNQYPGATEIPNNSVDEDCNGSDLNTLGAQLAQYTFTGNSCATPVHSVVAQPANAIFSDYSADSVSCASGNDFFNYLGWNNSATVDSTEFYQFSITPDNCFELALTQLTFTHRSSNAAGLPIIHVRSSLDNFATDIYTVQIATPSVAQTENVPLSGPFSSISGPVTFRFYITEILGTTTTYRHDNVSVYGAINALPQQTYYVDADGDGFGDAAIDSMDCTAPAGYVSNNTDCNDNNADENPNAVWYQDSDNDTFGNSAVTLTQCTQPAGYVAENTDCDDNNSNVGGSITYYEDADNDTYGNSASTTQACTQPVGYVLNAGDCDDNNSAITVATDEFYIDQDNDGFGSIDVIVTACTQPVGYVSNADDCDDNDNSITLGSTFYEDGDNDNFGNPNSTIVDCTAPNGYVADSTDCDDTNNGINPNATDVLGNSIDENCDGTDGNLGLTDATIAAFNVFPNPGTAAVTITLNGSWNANVIVTILSVDGKTVQTATGSSNEVTVATAELLPSVYFVRVSDGTHTSLARWVKQ